MRLKSLSWIFIPFLLAALRATGMAQIATTQIVDTIYHADGTTATGTALIAWPAFTTTFGDQVPAGSTSAVIGSGGALSISLVPNSGSIPVGTYYTVTYHLDDNSVTRQYWVVPQSTSPLKIAAIESSVMPTSIAIQTATKAYVDTAIAAATTGHPLDSTPLVLKAGDTMTGPLVLPADPVSSLQAATKHYVDSTVASQTANLGSFSGQTPNYLPLATSATSSTVSSHFFETNGTSGVTNPFQLSANSPYCNLNGVTFTRWGCNNITIYDDGTTDPSYGNSLTGTVMTMQAWGTAGAGDAEGRVTTLFGDSNNGAIVTPGGKFGWVSNTNFFGIGDSLFTKNTHECHAGLAYASDQGCQLYYNKLTDAGFWHGTILSGGSNTQPKVNGTGGCANPENQSCAPSNGWIMVDSSQVIASGHITGAPTLSSPVAWTSSSPTDMRLPTPSAWGTAIGVNIVAGTPWNDPRPQTFTIGSGGGTGSGTFTAGDLACVIGNKFHEQQTISVVTGTAGAQTITIPLSRPETSVLVVKGQCQYVMSTANDAHGMTYVLPATSIDGSHLIVSRVGFSGVSPWEGGLSGNEWWTSDGTANSAVNVYAGARILWVGTSAPGFFPFNGSNIALTLEPNTFATGDNLFSPDYPLQKFDGEEEFVNMQMPANSAGGLTGKRIHLSGPGLSGLSQALLITNDQDASTYTPNGGPLSEPALLANSGYWGSLHFGGYTPLNFGFNFANHQPGQTSYQVWHDPSWGQLSIDSTNTWNFLNSAIHVQNGLTVGGGASVGTDLSVGSPSGTFGSITVSQSSTPENVIARFAGGYSGGGLGSLRGGIVLGETGGGSINDRAYLRLRADGAAHTGLELGTNNFGHLVPGFYMSPDDDGNGISIANGSNNCSTMLCLGSNIKVTHPGDMGGNNSTIDFGTNYGALDLIMYNGGPANRYGWGLTPGTMNFVVPPLASSGGHFVFADGGDLGAGNALFTLTRAAASLPASGVFAFSTTESSSGSLDTGISRAAAATVSVGNGTAGDATGTLKAADVNAQLYQGPATAPTGACSVVGWAFSQDGHISYCNGSTWIQKI